MITNHIPLAGEGVWKLYGPSGELIRSGAFQNKITNVGDQMYAERAVEPPGVTPPPAPTGMQLGLGSTAAAKTGAGAAIVTYISGSSQGFDPDYPSSSMATRWQLIYRCTWVEGIATAEDIREVAIVNQGIGINSAAPVASTISRGLVGPIDKASDQVLVIDYTHTFGSA